MASVALLAVFLLSGSFPARAQDTRTDQAGSVLREYVDKGYCTYTYVVPPGSRTEGCAPPGIERQLAETKEETGRLENQVDVLTSLVQILLSQQSDLTSSVNSWGDRLKVEENLTQELQEQKIRLQILVENHSSQLSTERIRSAELAQNLTQEIQDQESRLLTQLQEQKTDLQTQVDNLAIQLSEEKGKTSNLEQNLTQKLQEQETRIQTHVQNLTQELQEQESRLLSRVQNLSDELSDEKTRGARLVQNLTQTLLLQETKFIGMINSLSDELSEERNINRELALNLTQTLLNLDNMKSILYEHDVTIKQRLNCTCERLVPGGVVTTTAATLPRERTATTQPSESVSTTVAPVTDMTSPTELPPSTRCHESTAAAEITTNQRTVTAQPSTPHPTTESAGPATGIQIRLAGGSTPLEGRVEVRNGTGQWGSVCDDNFDLQDAHVVCRQLGFGAALEVKLAGHFGEGSGNVWLDEVACRGNETDLGDCPADSWGPSDCSHKEDVGVVCEGGGSLRLVGGVAPWGGRLEFRPWQAAEWGTVCNTSWTEAETEFVCRQLGYTGGVSANLAAFGEGNGRFWLGDVTCDEGDISITSCDSSWEPSDCDHCQDVAVVCTGGVSVRLTGIQSPLQGRVEVRSGELEWGTVCDDGFDDRDAQVVCRQLGYRGGVATAGGDFGEGTGNIWLQNVGCSGAESSVEDCQIQSWGNQDCSHSQDAGVVCTGEVSIRLTGGQSSSEGRVEVRPENGDWGTVCDDGFDDRDAQVVCRQLRYITGSARVGGVFPEGTGNIWLDNLNCAGNESSVADCEINRWGDHDCTHKEDAGVVCVLEDDCAGYHSSGWTTSGVYPIGLLPANVEAYCDMDTTEGGWTVIQRRQDGSVPFNRTWEEYKLGFGNKSGEYWLGNENIHLLTNQKNYRLRIDLVDWNNESRYAEYSTFSVSGDSDGYRLHISGYSGTAGNSMAHNNGRRFSTVDRDNDDWSSGHCSQGYGQVGWWFGLCSNSCLNGRYLGNCGSSCPVGQGVMWYHWRGFSYSLKSVSMKIRP
ncbi:uncharacterized protein LOC118407459 [Branchiostoma floridae]|uniref:Soluble scavenger receptor cysteine-rich domain-containing protein SSC5D n=1 Tax=Branchiostoma floridae TaxID=7739 RepID=A0A9J7HUW4_BRAFL|nr:uncharacterized protein LOC118407459 [Branchiostoma floridae]